MNKILFAVVGSLAAAAEAMAHPGHAMPGEVHWHATDVAGLAFVVASTLLAVCLSKGK